MVHVERDAILLREFLRFSGACSSKSVAVHRQRIIRHRDASMAKRAFRTEEGPMVHLLFPDGTTRELEDALSVTKDEDTGSASCIDAGGKVLATYARGEILAFSSTPFPIELIEALQNAVTAPIQPIS